MTGDQYTPWKQKVKMDWEDYHADQESEDWAADDEHEA